MEDAVKTDPLIALLVENGLLSEAQLEDVVEEHTRTGHTLRDIVIDGGIVNEDDLLVMIANQLGTIVVDLAQMEIPPEVVKSIPATVARMYDVIPVEVGPTSITLASAQFLTAETIDEIRFVLTRDVTLVLAREESVKMIIARSFGDEGDSVGHMLTELESEIERGGVVTMVEKGSEEAADELMEMANATPVIRFVHLVLYQAVQEGASDIHFEPFEKEFKIRYRVDGALYELQPPPHSLALPVISRLKVMSNLNIAERRFPQDGRVQMIYAGRHVDFRVSTLPTQFGESVVLRILDQDVVSLGIENLGMSQDIFDRFTMDILKPNGIVVVTGPTGSGKTTTLYSALKRINSVESKILTVEDPVEYDVEGLIQVQVNEAIEVTFQSVLRAFLRQDPDIIMLGEIRDKESATLAIQASLTGHLVFSTLHTNDAAGAITRLIDMGIEPFLISSTLESVLAQRLVRKLCTACRQPYEPDAELLERMNLSKDRLGGKPFYSNKGCSVCHQIGYKGRKGIYELLPISNDIRRMINDRRPTMEIQHRAIENGMRVLREDGIDAVMEGLTTAEEILRYT